MKGNLLITGGSGLLALNWASAMKNHFNVTLGLHKRLITLSDVTTKCFSLDSIDAIKLAFEDVRPSIVIHTAGLTNVEVCEQNPDAAFHINVKIAENISIVCADLNTPLVHISTDHLFSGMRQNTDETIPVSPQNVYAQTKAAAEVCVSANYPDALVIRTNFYGWGPKYRPSFSDMIINKLRNFESIILFEDVYFTPTFSQCLIKAVHDLVSMKKVGIYNVVGDERISKYDFGIKIANELKLDLNLIKSGLFLESHGLVKRPLDMSLSNKKVCESLGRGMGSVTEHLHLLKKQEILGFSQEVANL